jgi:hypothetical protein
LLSIVLGLDRVILNLAPKAMILASIITWKSLSQCMTRADSKIRHGAHIKCLDEAQDD